MNECNCNAVNCDNEPCRSKPRPKRIRRKTLAQAKEEGRQEGYNEALRDLNEAKFSRINTKKGEIIEACVSGGIVLSISYYKLKTLYADMRG